MVAPLLGLGLGLQGAGIFAKYGAARSAEAARQEAIANEIARQQGYQQEAAGIFRPVMAAFTAPNQMTQRAGVALDRERALTANQGAPLPTLPGAGSAPEAVRQEGARYISRAVGEGKDFARRLARMGAYGESDFANRLKLAGSRRGLDNVADLASSSVNVLPLELAAAQAKAASPLGDLLMGAGQMAGIAGAFGMGPSWADIFGGSGVPMGPPGFSGQVGPNNMGRMI